ncbi:MAG: ABC transporter ATP-binding protein [Fimbriimonadales bacterium]|nr:ABC transporter ATP-binding protein [Fimbriimonadales bacterium]
MWELRCQSLGKRFGERWVFRGLSLQVAQGMVLIVRGANGSGKSTFIRLIAGLLAPTEGQITLGYDGQPVADRTRWLGWCATDGALYRELTAYEHLRWWATVRGLCPEPLARRDTLMAHLQRFELADRAHERVRTYSTGMRQRLRLAIATLGEPPLLLLDEPDAGLDTAGLQLIEQVLDEQRARGIAVFATNRAEGERWGDLCLAMGA